MAHNSKKRKNTEELVQELRDFNHYEAATRLERLKQLLDGYGLCEYCGRDNCERKRT